MPKGKTEKVLTCNVIAESGRFDCNLNGEKIEINAIHMHNPIPFTPTWAGYKDEMGRLKAQKKFEEKEAQKKTQEAEWAEKKKQKQAEREARFGKK